MNRLIVWVLVGAALLAFSPAVLTASNSDTALSPDQIMSKAVERAASMRTPSQDRPAYQYTKHTVTEDFDKQGRVKGRKEKLYDVSVASGLSFPKLRQLNGQDLSPSELKKQDEREAAERQRMTDAKPGQKGDQREDFLTAELVAKYDFTLLDQKVINGRNAYRLAFEPKPGLPVKKFTDRFANQIVGTVWIDTEDFEIARAELHLRGEVTLWGGMIGCLKFGQYTLERTRLADGAWFNSSSNGVFEGRKLLEPMVVHTRSESSNFHRAGGLALQ